MLNEHLGEINPTNKADNLLTSRQVISSKELKQANTPISQCCKDNQGSHSKLPCSNSHISSNEEKFLKSKVSTVSPILKNKAVFDNKNSLSLPVSCSNSSNFFSGLLKDNEIISTQSSSPISQVSCFHSTYSKSNTDNSISKKENYDEDAFANISSQVKSKESIVTCCLDDHSKYDKNSGALNELATGSLATCSSILEVGKEDQQKEKSFNTLSATKLRLYIASDKIPKHLFEGRKLSRHQNGIEIERNSNSLDISHISLQPSKTFDCRSFSQKSPSYDSSKLSGKSSTGIKSNFCEVYSSEQFFAPSKTHKPAARKSVIELKSKSLDPPLENDLSKASSEENSLTFQQTKSSLFPSRLPSRSLSHNHSDNHPAVTKRRDSETAVLSIADVNWLQKISDKQKSFSENASNPSIQKSLNIQKLKAFFGETTPKIMEAKEMKNVKRASKDDLCIKPVSLDFQRCSDRSSCKCTTAITPVVSRSKKVSTLCFKDSLYSPLHSSKKPHKDRESTNSPLQFSKQHKTWRGKMAQTLKRYGSGATPPLEQYTGALGVPLEHCVSSFANQYVPLIVETCTRIVEERGLNSIGVYRVPGNSGSVNALIDLLQKDSYAMCLESERWQDVNLVSSLLKLFFRKLPDSLVTDELYESFIMANRLENPERRMLKMKKLIHELPEHNFETFSFLAQHLNRVASHEEVNKMDSHNLAIVFGPTLVRPQEDGMLLMVKDMQDQVKVVETVITHCDWLFSSWDEDVYVPVDDEDDVVPVSGINSVLLEKAEKIDNRSSLSF